MRQGVPKGGGGGFYFGITLQDTGVGGGVWMVPKERMDGFRSHLATHHAELTGILGALRSEYGELKGDKLKRVPKPYDADHPAGEYLKHKGTLREPETCPWSWRRRPISSIRWRNQFRRMMPLVRFLDQALGAA